MTERMELLSVNVSLPKKIEHEGRRIETGIFKEPAPGRVRLRSLNLDGDGQADQRVHGGADKAVYVYSVDNYEYWKRRLGRDDLDYGQFGENFTVTGMTDDVIRIGDIFTVGGATVQVSQPRLPCEKLGIRMGMPTFSKLFLSSRRTGFYLRVLEEGEVGAGDRFRLTVRDPKSLTVDDIVRLYHVDRGDLEGARAALRVKSLADGFRKAFAERVRKAEGRATSS